MKKILLEIIFKCKGGIRSHQAKARAKAKTIKIREKKIKDLMQMANIKENFSLRVCFCQV